jgi:hypothetical protein
MERQNIPEEPQGDDSSLFGDADKAPDAGPEERASEIMTEENEDRDG